MSSDELSVWDDARQLADDLEIEVYFESMDARDRWHKLELRLVRLQRRFAHSEPIDDAGVHELHEVRGALRALLDGIYAHAIGAGASLAPRTCDADRGVHRR